jgi:hypothetical protein
MESGVLLCPLAHVNKRVEILRGGGFLNALSNQRLQVEKTAKNRWAFGIVDAFLNAPSN